MTYDRNKARQTDDMESLESALTASTRDQGLWKDIWQQIRLIWYLLRDPEVPLYLKVVPLIAVIYALLPTDFVPDVFPVLGQLDDITALIVGGKVFIELAPPQVVARYAMAMRKASKKRSMESGEEDEESGLEQAIVIEGEYEAVDEKSGDQAG